MCEPSTELRKESKGDAAASPALVRVMIVDDQQPFRAAARAVVERVAGLRARRRGRLRRGRGGGLCRAAAPDLVLMDINMGALDGIEATRLITAADPSIKVILVSTYALDDLPPGARTSGAIAYVNKDELSPKMIRRLWEAGGDPAWSNDRVSTSRRGTVP